MLLDNFGVSDCLCHKLCDGERVAPIEACTEGNCATNHAWYANLEQEQSKGLE
jgi:hypothetical protein